MAEMVVSHSLRSVFSIYFIFAKVPETKGLTLEEIEQQFAELEKARATTELTAEREPLLEL